jgi:anionic cell wall polymer biosynthesis LytR-Cps2A-Psr (LCP) family protein
MPAKRSPIKQRKTLKHQKRSRRNSIKLNKRPVKGGGVGEDVYDGAATFGRFMAWIGLIICAIIAIILIIVGVYLLTHPGKYTAKTKGIVTKSDCRAFTERNGSHNMSCDVTAEYEVEGTQLETRVLLTGESNETRPGQAMELVYDPRNPQDAKKKLLSRATIGWILIGIAIFIVVAAAVHLYLVKRFKFAAAASGVGQGINMAT